MSARFATGTSTSASGTTTAGTASVATSDVRTRGKRLMRHMRGAAMAERHPAIGPAATGPVLALDPGYERSAWCLYEAGRVQELGTADNLAVKYRIATSWSVGTVLAVEMVESYGMCVG